MTIMSYAYDVYVILSPVHHALVGNPAPQIVYNA